MAIEVTEQLFGEAQYKRLYTVEEFEAFMALPENAGFQFELIHGEIVEKVPTEQHGIIGLRIGSRILFFVDLYKLGRVGVEIRHRLPHDRYNSRQPDVSFRAGLDNPPITQGSVPQMPDLAVEVKSPDDTYKGMRERAEYYLQNGSKLVWLVYTEKAIVEVCTRSSERHGAIAIRILKIDEALDGGDVLPGFILSLADIFKID